jgi:hypothetical protein
MPAPQSFELTQLPGELTVRSVRAPVAAQPDVSELSEVSEVSGARVAGDAPLAIVNPSELGTPAANALLVDVLDEGGEAVALSVDASDDVVRVMLNSAQARNLALRRPELIVAAVVKAMATEGKRTLSELPALEFVSVERDSAVLSGVAVPRVQASR